MNEKPPLFSKANNMFTEAQKKRMKQGAYDLEIEEAKRAGDYVEDIEPEQKPNFSTRNRGQKSITTKKAIFKHKTRPKLKEGDVDWVTRTYG